jgi:hypothetical protein
MRPFPNQRIERFRLIHLELENAGVVMAGTPCGIFGVRRKGAAIRIISHDGIDEDERLSGWEHVSVSLEHRCPSWEEMQFVKELFWDDKEMVVQYHPPKSDYINCHPFCLHLWKPIGMQLPFPPIILV